MREADSDDSVSFVWMPSGSPIFGVNLLAIVLLLALCKIRCVNEQFFGGGECIYLQYFDSVLVVAHLCR